VRDARGGYQNHNPSRGETIKLVRSVLGTTSPMPPARWTEPAASLRKDMRPGTEVSFKKRLGRLKWPKSDGRAIPEPFGGPDGGVAVGALLVRAG
jgi:hypothetical protein